MLIYELSLRGTEISPGQDNPHTWEVSARLHHRLPIQPVACHPASVSHEAVQGRGEGGGFSLPLIYLKTHTLKIA